MSNTTIPSINMRDLSHDHLRSLCSGSASVWNGIETVPDVIGLSINGIEQTLPIHLKVMYRDRSSEYRIITSESEARRDKAYSLFSKKVYAATEEWDEIVAAAARKIHEVLVEMGKNLPRLAYSEQSERTKQIVQTLSTAEYQGYIELAGVKEDFIRVDETNNDFIQKWDDRLDGEIDTTELPPMKAVRNDLETDLRTLLNMTEYLFDKGHQSVSAGMVEKMAAHVSEIKALIKTDNDENEE